MGIVVQVQTDVESWEHCMITIRQANQHAISCNFVVCLYQERLPPHNPTLLNISLISTHSLGSLNTLKGTSLGIRLRALYTRFCSASLFLSASDIPASDIMNVGLLKERDVTGEVDEGEDDDRAVYPRLCGFGEILAEATTV